jgi:Flp pilus assembly pilin Flp
MNELSAACAYLRALVSSRVRSQSGASVIEYAFLISLIAAFCIGAVTLIGGATGASLSNSASKLP